MTLVKVCLGPGKRCVLADPGSEDLRPEERVVVENDEDLKLGRVTGVFKDIDPRQVADKVKHRARPATAQDLDRDEKNRALEERAAEFCRERIAAHRLPIYLVRVEVLFDTSKIVFYFTAPGRVDFRELVKDLVQEFRTRIELRQIGVRHRAKMVGGLGICGRGLCCASFLADFEPVSVRMAKEQQLSLNPNKISGICGRLMCCLTYEYTAYQQIRKHLPRVGKRLKLPEGEGKIVRYNLIRETVTVEMEEQGEVEIALADLPMGETPKE